MSEDIEAFKETWDTAYMNNLPDSAFLYIESGGKKDDSGKTEPRSLRHFPYKDSGGKIDLPHLRNAIARIPQSNAPGLNKDALQARARKLLSGQSSTKEINMAVTVKDMGGMDGADYAMHEGWDVQQTCIAISQVMSMCQDECDEGEMDEAMALCKIAMQLMDYMRGECDEMMQAMSGATGQGEGMTTMEVKSSLLERIRSAFKAGARHSAADQKNVQAIHDAASALGADCQMQVKQAKDGSWRWLMLSSNAYRDRDKETVSTKALENDCARADADGYYGPLRWWHVGEYDVSTKQAGPGADLGMCDFNAMHGRILIEAGTFKNERVALAVKAASPNLESSIGFFHPLTEPDGEGTFKSIRRFERSLLPRGKAANPLTALTVITQETQTMQKEKLEALKALVGDEEAASIVNQAEVVQKAADAAGLTFKAKDEAAPVAGNPSLKELTDSLAASLAPMIEAKVKEALTAYAQTVETKAAGQQAQIDKLNTAVKTLLGDLPRNAARGVIGIESDHNVVDNAKTKEFQPSLNQEQFPLANFTSWITGANPVVPTV